MQEARYTGLALAFIGLAVTLVGVSFLNANEFTDKENVALIPIFAGLFIMFCGLFLCYTNRKD